MQEREPTGFARDPLEALLARGDEEAHAWVIERLLSGEPVVASEAPPPPAEAGVESPAPPEIEDAEG
jgi:hypothetical protein